MSVDFESVKNKLIGSVTTSFLSELVACKTLPDLKAASSRLIERVKGIVDPPISTAAPLTTDLLELNDI